MKKLVILGCENSHANGFLKNFKDKKEFSDMQVIGVYSEDFEAAKKLHDEFGVKVMESYDEAVGAVDGVIITARHGKNHYKYAEPYIKSGVPMFIDKPITCDGDEALKFMRELKAANVKFCGGSMLIFDKRLQKMKEDVKNQVDGQTLGGFVRAPVNLVNPYGNFYFYSQHLVEMICEVFGYYPNYVSAHKSDKAVTAIFEYDEYQITAHFIESNQKYCIGRFTEKETVVLDISDDPTGERMYGETAELCSIMRGEDGRKSHDDFISPVFIMNAIEQAFESGKKVAVRKYTV